MVYPICTPPPHYFEICVTRESLANTPASVLHPRQAPPNGLTHAAFRASCFSVRCVMNRAVSTVYSICPPPPHYFEICATRNSSPPSASPSPSPTPARCHPASP